MVSLAGGPFGVAGSKDGDRWFVAQSSGRVALLSDRGARPRLVREIPIPGAFPAGEALTRDGRLLLVAEGSGVAVVSVPRAESGAAGPVLGQLQAPEAANPQAATAVEVAVSADGRFAFVSLEYADEIAVFDLADAMRHGFRRSGFVGTIPVGLTPVGLTLSPDGRWLYATSELTASDPEQGTLSVVSVKRAEAQPRRSVVARALAGCSPVRVAVSPNGAVVWVTARGSNSLLAFSASELRHRPARALLASVRVGAAPVGVAVLSGGSRVVVADSNRFSGPSQRGRLSLVDVRGALAHRPAVVGSLPAGTFPRDVAVVSDRLLVANFGSNELEVVDATQLAHG